MASSMMLFRICDISNDYTTNVQRSTAAVGRLFKTKGYRVVERVGLPPIGYRIGISFKNMTDLSRIISLMISYAQELGKRTTVYNLDIRRSIHHASGLKELRISGFFA